MGQGALATLVAKDEIREIGLLYCRGVDRYDIPLLRSLYAKGATDTHGNSFDGDAEAYCDFLEQSLPHLQYSGHHVCNHLISVDGDEGEGEIYAIAIHVYRNAEGALVEDVMTVRYIDRYRKEGGRWRFAKRVVSYDSQSLRPFDGKVAARPEPGEDASYAAFASGLLGRNPRG